MAQPLPHRPAVVFHAAATVGLPKGGADALVQCEDFTPNRSAILRKPSSAMVS